MNNILSKDITIHHILNDLSVIDLYNFSLTCKSYSKISINYLDIIKDNIEDKLSEIFSSKLPEFKLLLEKLGGIISGSFVLQCLLKEKWEESDIDIYIPIIDNDNNRVLFGNPKTEMDDFIFNLYSIFVGADRINHYTSERTRNITFLRDFLLLSPIGNLENKENVRYVIDECQSFNNNKYNKTVFEYIGLKDKRKNYNSFVDEASSSDITISGDKFIIYGCGEFKIHRIQVILVNASKNGMKDFINREFDFSICKNIISYQNSKCQIYINSFNDILTKNARISCTTNIKSNPKRKEKYQERGFTFT